MYNISEWIYLLIYILVAGYHTAADHGSCTYRPYLIN